MAPCKKFGGDTISFRCWSLTCFLEQPPAERLQLQAVPAHCRCDDPIGQRRPQAQIERPDEASDGKVGSSKCLDRHSDAGARDRGIERQTRSMLETDQKLAGLDSTLKDIKKNADGSVTV
jgi:hypothetical protein